MATLTVSDASSADPRESSSVASAGASPSRRAVIAGRVVSGLGVAFLTMDGAFKILMPQAVVNGGNSLGFSADAIFRLGLLETVLLVTYLIPRTAVLGAVLWSGYLGGAVASHVRLGNPWLSHALFPVYVATFLWLGLWLRDARVRALTRG